jgi:ribonucleoside-diphosphate reductase alpha subunit
MDIKNNMDFANVQCVTKRNGVLEPVEFDKITKRINTLIKPNERDLLNAILVAQKVVPSLYPNITTIELDILAANICADLATVNPLYSNLAGRILVSNLHKNTEGTFSTRMTLLSKTTTVINSVWYQWVLNNAKELDEIIDPDRDYLFDYFGFKTLERSYLLKSGDKIIERPQDMILRAAIRVHMGNPNNVCSVKNLNKIKQIYDLISLQFFTLATPTLFNSGTSDDLASCFLMGLKDDLNSLTNTMGSCANISASAGGMGLHVSNIRGKNSLIKSSNGRSNGLVPLLRVFNDIARWIDQGGKRPGSIAIYLEPHHPDILDFLDLRKNFGSETERARDLFLALWISDLFMKQVEADADWYLLSADKCPNLPDLYGDAFEKQYWEYVKEGKYSSKISARKLWQAIMTSQIETGMPYILYKDHINHKSNQKNIGTIKSSNLCAEIVEYSDDKEYAVCNLASIGLKSYITPFKNNEHDEWIVYTLPDCKYCTFAKQYLTNMKIKFSEIEYTVETCDELKKTIGKTTITYPQIVLNDKLIGGWSDLYYYVKGTFNFDTLYSVAYNATESLNNIIDINHYPVPQAKLSNMKHRPIGLGIQGLADTLALLRIPFDSEQALELNAKIMETIYLASITASNDIAKSRYEGMNKLIVYFNKVSVFAPPDFYESTYSIDDEELNILYHDLQPNKYELDKLPSTISGAYSTFEGSPFSHGKFQFDLWSNDIKLHYPDKWEELRKSVIKYGTRNSLLTALMPTASTSQILGNNECFEYFTSNFYTRNTQSGDFFIVNKYLVNDLIKIGLWNQNLKNKIIALNGSIQAIDEIPNEYKLQYKTIWEIKQIWVLKAALARAPFVDQTQSMNIYMAQPDFQRLSSSHFWAWKNGLKTGMYYLRSKPSSDAIKFTIDPSLLKNDEGCTNCSA